MKTTNDKPLKPKTHKPAHRFDPTYYFSSLPINTQKLSNIHRHYQIFINTKRKKETVIFFLFFSFNFIINNFKPSDQRAKWLTWQQWNGRSSWPSMKMRRACTRSRGASKTWFPKIPKIPSSSSTLNPLVQFSLPLMAQVIFFTLHGHFRNAKDWMFLTVILVYGSGYLFSADIIAAVDKYSNDLAECVVEKAKKMCKDLHDVDVSRKFFVYWTVKLSFGIFDFLRK